MRISPGNSIPEKYHFSLRGFLDLASRSKCLNFPHAAVDRTVFRSIFTLGPSFEIDAQATATIDLDLALDVDLAYGISDLQLFFPPSSDHQSRANVAPKDTRKF